MPLLGILGDSFIEAFGEAPDRDRAMRVVILEGMKQGLSLCALRPQHKAGPAAALFSLKTQNTFLVTREGVSIASETPTSSGWEPVRGQTDLQVVFRVLFSASKVS
ncbi:hypothetical protein [Pseudomonas saponiphila]|nr:hypothetical protein [Pseudomonas saponiphila]